jgi:Ca2+-binding RTX toxin-like protein
MATYVGGSGNDLLIGLAGSDSLDGRGGDDILDAVTGADNPYHAYPRSSGEVNTLSGGLGDDVFIAWGSDVLQDAGGLSRLVIVASGSYTMPEGFDNLRIAGNTLADEHFWVAGNSSSNVILAGNYHTTVLAGAGDDRVYGGFDPDNLQGGEGDDWLHGGNSHDYLTGDAGADHFVLDTFDGWADFITDMATGIDEIHLDKRIMTTLGARGDLAAGDARFVAGDGLTGGQDASDRIVYDTADGSLYYDPDGSGGASARLVAVLEGAPALAATDIVIETGRLPGAVIYGTNAGNWIIATQYDDTIRGLGGNDQIEGLMGDDSIYGGDGKDWIKGGGGNDFVSGGRGRDSYVFREYGVANADTVANFNSGRDALRFDSSGFLGLDGAGRFTAGDERFYAAAGASAAHDVDDRLVYDTSSGRLYYDADGAGGADAQLIATLEGAPALLAADIRVI